MDRAPNKLSRPASREAFHDLFAVNVKANELTTEQVKNKLKTLFAGKKTQPRTRPHCENLSRLVRLR